MIRVLVLDAFAGGGSFVGKAAVGALVASTSRSAVEVCVAVQDPSQMTLLEGISQTFTFPTSSSSGLETGDGGAVASSFNFTNDKAFIDMIKNVHRIFVVTPKLQDPVPFTTAVLDAVVAQEHNTMESLELLLLASNTLVGIGSDRDHATTVGGGASQTMAAKQCRLLEEYAKKKLQNKICIARIPSSPLFLDHLSVYANHIQDSHALLDPRDPNKPFWNVAVDDVADACAMILTTPRENINEQHLNKTYDLVSDTPFCLNDLANYLSQKLRSDPAIFPNRVSYENTQKGMLKYGMPEWQVESVLELFHAIDSCDDDDNTTMIHSAVEQITGKQPMTWNTWIDKNISQFQNVSSTIEKNSSEHGNE